MQEHEDIATCRCYSRVLLRGTTPWCGNHFLVLFGDLSRPIVALPIDDRHFTRVVGALSGETDELVLQHGLLIAGR